MGDSKSEKRAKQYATKSMEMEQRMNELLEKSINSQMAHYNAMEPIYLRESGLKKVTKDDGTFSYEQLNPEMYERGLALEKQGMDIAELSNQRTMAALKGELPVSAGLERDISTSDRILKEGLQKRLGSGYADSTPGAYRLAEHDARANELRESERRGEIAGANQLSLAAQQVTNNRTTNDYFGANNSNKIGMTAGGGGVAPTGQAMQLSLAQLNASKKAMKYGAKKNLQGALIGGGLQLGGQLAGGMAGYYGGAGA